MFPKIQEIIDVLKKVDNSPKSKLGFDMTWTFEHKRFTKHACGSACCIGGHAAQKLQSLNKSSVIEDITFAIMELCDVPEGVADELCYPPSNNIKYKDVALEDAIKVLEKCKNEGVVDWSIASAYRSN